MGNNNPRTDIDSSALVPNPATCLIKIITPLDDLKSTQSESSNAVIANGTTKVAVSKRLGRGAVNSGLTCECGVFGAMACGEWPTQRVSTVSHYRILNKMANSFNIVNSKLIYR